MGVRLCVVGSAESRAAAEARGAAPLVDAPHHKHTCTHDQTHTHNRPPRPTTKPNQPKPETVLLVRGYKGASCWGFPRGKIMRDESDADCAVREVLEETGYDLEGLLNEKDHIELVLEGKRNRLYIAAGLDPESAKFAPKCKGVSCGDVRG